MSYKEDDSLTDGIADNTDIGDTGTESTEQLKEPGINMIEVNNHDAAVRKKIDDLLEQKRLKNLLDESDDW